MQRIWSEIGWEVATKWDKIPSDLELAFHASHYQIALNI
jgi:hypothetical protein